MFTNLDAALHQQFTMEEYFAHLTCSAYLFLWSNYSTQMDILTTESSESPKQDFLVSAEYELSVTRNHRILFVAKYSVIFPNIR